MIARTIPLLFTLALFGCDPGDKDTAEDADGDGVASTDGDCDDGDATRHPGAAELCDGIDNDCDDAVDEEASDASTFYGDADGDGYGAERVAVQACEPPSSAFVAEAGDCDDGDPAINPAGVERCDAGGADEDCDGAADDLDTDAADKSTWYEDADGDGFGSTTSTVEACDAPAGYTADAQDCDDTNPAVNPGAEEVCDELDVDEDCDGLADDLDPGAPAGATLYYDGDGDGYGDATIAIAGCEAGGGWVTDATDCDDDDPGDHPGAVEEVGNGDDDDCDGVELCYVDADGDGYPAASGATVASADADCSDPGEAVAAAGEGDCDDATASVSPDGVESCNEVDDDCDGVVDDGVGSTWYLDDDGDGYGVAESTTIACSAPAGYAAVPDDCDDTEAAANPGMVEVCGDGVDNDCDGDWTGCVFEGTYAATSHDYRLTGTNSSDWFGRGIAVGDFDGDGQTDLAGGAYQADSPSSSAGQMAMWYGPLVDSGSVADTADVVLTGVSSSNYLGYALATADHDGDGADEVVVGAYGTSSSAGAVYLVYGGAGRSGTGTITTASDVATITGVTSSDYLGFHVSGGGDMDGDGTEEILLGAYGHDGGGTTAGAAYLFYGSSSRRTGSAAASTADATILGNTGGVYLGYATALVDDMNGDGLAELLVGAQYESGAGSSSGASFLFLGDTSPLSGTLSASEADVTWYGTAANDYAGYGVYNLTDLDDDGYAEAGVHGYGYDAGGVSAVGALWIYPGGASLPASPVATLYGAASSDSFGEDATSVGDQDGDGVNDLLVGAYGVDTAYTSAGAAYLFYGPIVGSVSASAADATFLGSTGGDGYFGRRLPDEPADITGDGFEDLVIGAFWDDSTAYDVGAIYVWAGRGGP